LLQEFLQKEFPEIEVQINPDRKPRKKSFELVLESNEKVTTLWSGLTRGPPQRLKWPPEMNETILTSIRELDEI